MTEPDQYGQAHPIETQDVVIHSLKEFEAAVEAIPAKDKPSLTEAQQKCPQLLTDDFKLQFLRCEVFNEKVCTGWRMPNEALMMIGKGS